MALGAEDQNPHDHLNFLWENQSWGLSNSENSDDETNKNKLLDITSNAPPQNKGLIFIGESSNGGVVGGESNVKNNKRNYRDIRSHGKRATANGGGGDGKCREADHELHIWTERERRKKMRNMFANLHALLPQLPSKADKSSIVDEAVSYIKSLEKKVEKLEKLKREKDQAVSPIGCESSVINSFWNPYFDSDQASSGSVSNSSSPVAFNTFVSPNLVLTMFANNEAQYCICATKKQGLSTTIAFVLEKYKLDVISASILSSGNANRYMILAHANKALIQFQDAASVEQTFRRAAAEIMMWLS